VPKYVVLKDLPNGANLSYKFKVKVECYNDLKAFIGWVGRNKEQINRYISRYLKPK